MLGEEKFLKNYKKIIKIIKKFYIEKEIFFFFYTAVRINYLNSARPSVRNISNQC